MPVATKTKPVAHKPKRTRLAPEVRATQILDCAAHLILVDGFTDMSMERIARGAGVSKALIYNYFPNLNDLLRALLAREVEELRNRSAQEVGEAANFEDLIRRTTRMYLGHIHERGPLLQRLWKEPAVARMMAEVDQRSRNETLRYFVKMVRREYDLPLEVAISAVDMQMAMTETAAQHLSMALKDVELATDVCARLLLGGLDSLAKAYGRKRDSSRV